VSALPGGMVLGDLGLVQMLIHWRAGQEKNPLVFELSFVGLASLSAARVLYVKGVVSCRTSTTSCCRQRIALAP
jgi:hypothetical protein